MEAGYKPWLDPTSKNGQRKVRPAGEASAPNHLQACVRMLRADYCGDGRTFTTNGKTLEFWDSMTVHRRTQFWVFEAAWSPEGAVCFSKPRDHTLTAAELPSCLADRTMVNRECEVKSDMTGVFETGKYLFSHHPRWW